MNIVQRVGLRVFGEIVLFQRKDGQDTKIGHMKNLILNSAADFSAKALGGIQTINGMYFAFTNNGVYTPPAVTVERTAEFYQTTGSTGTLGFVRVPTISEPVFTATDAIYNNNKISVTAVSTSITAIPSGSNDVTDGVTKFYGAALAWLADDMVDDVLFSAINFSDIGPTFFDKIAGAQLGIRWGIYFEN